MKQVPDLTVDATPDIQKFLAALPDKAKSAS
jgi:hypothetical protein